MDQLIEDLDGTRRVVDALSDLGVGIALDDFGTGYSSLSYLQLFPFSYVKIDRPFVDRAGSAHANSAIAAAIVQMTTSLGLKSVAEIVETEEFLDLLAALTAADAQATGPTAWTTWRRGLIDGLVEKTRAVLDGTAAGETSYEGWPASVPLPAAGELTMDEMRAFMHGDKVPAALATVEALGRRVTGKELITAIAVGGDLIPRIRVAAVMLSPAPEG